MTPSHLAAQRSSRKISGTVVTSNNEAVKDVSIIVRSIDPEKRVVTNQLGQFDLEIPDQDVTLRVEGPYIKPLERIVRAEESPANFRIQIEYLIPPIHQSIVITATALQPQVETYNDEVYKKTLFSRDDQLLETLNVGINAGQHEGGGKSLEVRRFGFNLDHGGTSGGLKVLVDNVQQNQGTQGHGQGYLGALKALTPELVDEVHILNGPFSAEYGDFSGLGVVHIRLKESLPDTGTIRLQAGSFGSYRTFLAYSPTLNQADAFLSYEGSRTDGPFDSELRYNRDNVTGNYTRHLSGRESLGLKLNFGRNDFFSSGQIPLDLVSEGSLSRFGFIDPSNGGRVRLGTTGIYYRKTFESGDIFKVDGFVSRSLFDLYSNFTFFLNDPVSGDGIQQHDSRLQEGANSQYLHPYTLFGGQALLTAGVNFHANQINVSLYPQRDRVPSGVTTSALAHVTNVAGYVDQGMDFWRGKLHINAGLRWDHFRFSVTDQVTPMGTVTEAAARPQPKLGAAFRPSRSLPLTLSYNYGRGINTQDARGIASRPDAPRIATTDFHQIGAAYQAGSFSFSSDLFLIDRSNEQVYIPDDGSFELSDPSRSYGFEGKTSLRLNRFVSLTGGVTRVTNAFYRSTSPRLYVDSAPHTVANGGVTLSGWRGFYTSLRYRHISNYRLDGEDAAIRASGLGVFDLAVTKTLRPWADLNLSVDNLTNKVYYETQNYFASRVSQNDSAIERIHGTPGYPFGITVGLTFRRGGK
jgi:hypothetical protein